jgi:hypothetical protein
VVHAGADTHTHTHTHTHTAPQRRHSHVDPTWVVHGSSIKHSDSGHTILSSGVDSSTSCSSRRPRMAAIAASLASASGKQPVRIDCSDFGRIVSSSSPSISFAVNERPAGFDCVGCEP